MSVSWERHVNTNMGLLEGEREMGRGHGKMWVRFPFVIRQTESRVWIVPGDVMLNVEVGSGCDGKWYVVRGSHPGLKVCEKPEAKDRDDRLDGEVWNVGLSSREVEDKDGRGRCVAISSLSSSTS